MAELEALRKLQEELSQSSDPNAQELAKLLAREIRRRENAGRKAKSKLSRREQNRLAQQRFRAKKKAEKQLDSKRNSN